MNRINFDFWRKLFSVIFLSLTIFWISLYRSQELINFASGFLIFCLICPALLCSKISFKDLKPFTYLSVYFFVGRLTREIDFDFLPKKGFWADCFGTPSNPGILNFLDMPLVIFTLVLTIYPFVLSFYLKLFTKVRQLNLNQKQWLLLNLFISISLSSFYSIVMLLDHLSFRSHAYDFGLHDQNFYLLSHLKLPPFSTVHQINNLWMDHQHFSQLLISPLYLLGNGFNGLTLVLITPFILITIPSIFIFLSFQKINTYFNLSSKNNYWLISFTSFLMWLHPATQSAVGFYFHERYLINLFVPIIIYFICLALTTKRSVLFLALSSLFSLFWLGVKEDQWIFTLVFWSQIGVWFYFFGKKIWDKRFQIQFATTVLLNIITSILYSTVFLRLFRHGKALENHAAAYNLILESGSKLIQTGNFYDFWDTMKFFSPDRNYLYQNYFIFDFPASILIPLNTAGNYLQRTTSSNISVRSTTFQYGSELAMYSCIGIIFAIIITLKFKPKLTNKIAISFLIIYVLGFTSIIGNNIYYLVARSPKIAKNYLNTNQERQNFNQIKQSIPHSSSIVTSPFYLPQISSREKIVNWPKTENITGDIKRYDIDVYSYDYWLLPKEKSWQYNTDYSDKITELKNSDRYSVIKENDYQILFRLKTTN